MATAAFDPVSQAADNITYWAYQAGFRGAALTRIVAYGLAESGGNPVAHNYNPSTGDDSYGVWQINYYGSLAQERTQTLGPAQSMLDPQKNAAAAFKLSNGGVNFSPWKADDLNGRYNKYLPYAQSSTAGLGGSAPGTPPTLPIPGYQTEPLADSGNPCLISLPSVGPLGGGCIFHESQGRAVLGALILTGGVIVTGLGVILLTGRSISGMIPGPVGMISNGLNAAQNRSEDKKVSYLKSIAPSDRSEFRKEARRQRTSSYSMDDVAAGDFG